MSNVLLEGTERHSASRAEELLADLDTAAKPRREQRPSAGPIITIDRLGVSYGKKQVLADVTFGVPEHRITALIGPSGCGKSTVLRCLNRMNDAITGFSMQGTVSLSGQDVYDHRVDVTELRRAVGMVFQQPNPFPMSVYENIALAVREHNARVSRSELDDTVEFALRQANLWDEVKQELKRSALGLSGGQQQRLCIARALAVKPAVILLDEPCASLDPISTARIEELLLELSNDYTIAIVTHNLAQAHRICDDVAFFLIGELVEVGPVAQVFENPRRRETAEYVRGAFG
jgi:phosphate transport system ATP-binding protein